MQKAAQQICEKYNGIFPNEYEQLLSLPGIGAYTAGAVASIAWNKPYAAVDGNVLRVVTRLTADSREISDTKFKNEITAALQEIYPVDKCGIFTQSLMELGNSRSDLEDLAANGESQRAMVTVVNVFSYGFIILISLISMTNVFNTISTSIALRRREFAMLRSVGLTQRGFARMMDYECIIYGARALLWGLPVSVLVTYGIYRSVAQSIAAQFYIPWYSVAIAVGSVFVVVFATMLYATRKIRSENPIEALKQENL